MEQRTAMVFATSLIALTTGCMQPAGDASLARGTVADRHRDIVTSLLAQDAWTGAVAAGVVVNDTPCSVDDREFTLADVAVTWTGFVGLPATFTAVLRGSLPEGEVVGSVQQIELASGHNVQCGELPFAGSYVVQFNLSRDEIEEEYSFEEVIASLQEGHDARGIEGFRTFSFGLDAGSCQQCDADNP